MERREKVATDIALSDDTNVDMGCRETECRRIAIWAEEAIHVELERYAAEIEKQWAQKGRYRWSV